MSSSFRNIFVIQLLFFVLICTILSLMGNGFSFILFGIFYCIVLLSIASKISLVHKRNFLNITCLFLVVYSFITILAHYIFISNPSTDFFINIDETTFWEKAVKLSKLSYPAIWSTSFSQFEYSGSPFFYAYTGTLQRLTDLKPFYGLLFQKLNVAFLGSLVPGIVYLLCSRIVNKRSAYRGAIAYGLFSFVLFYSVGLMRDIHIALIYAIGLYIITGNSYSLKNYIALIVLAVLAYFTRIENGLFLLAFLGIWALNSRTKHKFLIYIFSITVLVVGIYIIGGVDVILATAIKTSQGYTERSVNHAAQGSLGVMLNKLPLPFNYIGKSAFGQILPFPFWIDKFDSRNIIERIFYIPFALAGLFWFLVWTRIVVNFKEAMEFFKANKWVVILALLYIIAVSAGQAGPRRLMAVYPIIFMGYVTIDKKLFKQKEIIVAAFFYVVLLIIYAALKILL